MIEPDNEMGQRVLEQALQIWIAPELERRREAGLLPSDFVLRAAQIVMNVDAPTKVRLNAEVKLVVEVRPLHNRAIEVGDSILVEDVESIEGFHLTTDDPNAGHLSIVWLPGQVFIGWNFSYNATRNRARVANARQFLDAGRYALERGNLNAFVENALAGVEALAKARLMMLPDRAIMDSRKHRAVTAKYNRWAVLNDSERPYAEALNLLTKQRKAARYLEGELKIDAADAHEIMGVAEEFAQFVEDLIPERSEIPGALLNDRQSRVELSQDSGGPSNSI